MFVKAISRTGVVQLKVYTVITFFASTYGHFFAYGLDKIGPSIEPCGTPTTGVKQCYLPMVSEFAV